MIAPNSLTSCASTWNSTSGRRVRSKRRSAKPLPRDRRHRPKRCSPSRAAASPIRMYLVTNFSASSDAAEWGSSKGSTDESESPRGNQDDPDRRTMRTAASALASMPRRKPSRDLAIRASCKSMTSASARRLVFLDGVCRGCQPAPSIARPCRGPDHGGPTHRNDRAGDRVRTSAGHRAS